MEAVLRIFMNTFSTVIEKFRDTFLKLRGFTEKRLLVELSLRLFESLRRQIQKCIICRRIRYRLAFINFNSRSAQNLLRLSLILKRLICIRLLRILIFNCAASKKNFRLILIVWTLILYMAWVKMLF